MKQFNSLDEMLGYIRECSQQADMQVKPWQEAVKPGDYFVRFIEEGLTIYGKILDPVQSEIDAGADEDEVNYQRELRDAPHMKHYRFSKCYSDMCPEGELGDVHVATIAAIITEKVFNEVKERGWST